MRYTVKQLANLAGVTPRTLHYYDQIGLLRPTTVGENGYRYYDESALLRLQQIMFFRELDFPLAEIQAIIDQPDFNLVEALQEHRRVLQQRLGHLGDLLQTIERTLQHVQGTRPAAPHDLFIGFDEARQAQYEAEIAQRYGTEHVETARRRWASYRVEEKARIQQEGEAIYRDLVPHIGSDPTSLAVQRIMARWHEQIRYFYEPTREILVGLAEMYTTHPEFVKLYSALHPALPGFLSAAILAYCESLPQDHPSAHAIHQLNKGPIDVTHEFHTNQ